MLLSALLLALTVSGAQESGLSNRVAILQGAKVEDVVIEELGPEVQRFGLEQARLKTVTELHLRKHGVLGASNADGSSYVYVNVHVLDGAKVGLRGCVYNIAVRFDEKVTLRGAPRFVTTWTLSRLGATQTAAGCAPYLWRSLGETLDEFVNDYLAANPKTR